MKLKIGNEVRIKNTGNVYSTYKEWAIKHKLPEFTDNALPFKREKGFIDCIGSHGATGDDIYGVITLRGGFIVGKSGLTLIKKGG